MFKEGSLIVYRRDVCEIAKVKPKYYNKLDYLELVPINDKSLKMQVPADSPDIRKVITKAKAEELIDKINDIPVIDGTINDKNMELEYKNLLRNGTHEDLIRIIKTTYNRNQARLEQNKKTGTKDNTYFEMAEKLLYSELAIALKKDIETTKEYVISRVRKEK